MSKETKGNHPTTSEDSLLQSKICRPMGLRVQIPLRNRFDILLTTFLLTRAEI